MTVNVPPVLLLNVVEPPILVVKVPPVTRTSVGNPWYVVADIVVAVKPCNEVLPVTVKLPFTVNPVTEFIVAVKLDNPWFLAIVNVLFE